MIRLLFLFIIFATSLFAQNDKTCYTVQLVSKYSSQKNFNLLGKSKYPDSCKIMQIGKHLTVRCGCFKKIAHAKENLTILKKDYKKATIATTYRYRFNDKISLKNPSVVEKSILSPIKKKNSVSKHKKTCFTVQLVSRFNNSKNLSILKKNSYPDDCKVMEIGNTLTVRCGCYNKLTSLKGTLKELKQTYKGATIATTYRYRFDNMPKSESVVDDSIKDAVEYKTNNNSKNKKNSHSTQSDEELKLMLQVFLYKGDLKNAYKVATLGYEQNQNSYYWNQKMAEICKWTNRSARSMKHLRFMYEVKYDKKIEDELIRYGSSAYQYEEIEPLVVSRAKRNPTEKNIDLMILVYKKVGSPEKVVDILDKEYTKNPSNRMLLTKALELSLEIGDLEISKKYVDIIQKENLYSKVDAYLLAKYYYITHNIPLAYKKISQVKKEQDDKNLVIDYDKLEKEEKIVNPVTHEVKYNNIDKYYQLKSDLGWYLQDSLNAAKASRHLMLVNKARLVDYERISYVYQKVDPKLARVAIKKAYKEYKLSYLFFSYANSAINAKSYDDLNSLVEEIDKEQSGLTKEAIYWIIKSQLYAHYKQKDLEKKALLHALEIDPNNYQTKLTLLWFFVDMDDMENVKIILTDLTEDEHLDSSMYFPLASVYFDINEIDRASYYTQKLLYEDNIVTKSIEFKFLQAYIYQIQNNEGGFMTYMHEIVDELTAQAKKNPDLKHNNKFLSNYLRSAMYILNPDKFEKKLKKAKPYLTKKNYKEIAYSWAMKNHAYEKGLKLFNSMKTKELWILFNHDIINQRHTGLENLLYLYLHSLSMGDASQMSQKDGQWALAQSITFEGLRHNSRNQNVYIRHLDLSKERADRLNITTSYYNRDPLLRKYVKMNNKTYIPSGYFLTTDIDYFKNSTLDDEILVTVPDYSFKGGLKLRKLYNRGSIEIGGAYHHSMANYMEYSLDGKYRLGTDLRIDALLAKNMDAMESTQLLIGGKKDMLKVDLTWQILDSASIDFIQELNSYSSQDNVDIGKGAFSRVEINKVYRLGYPDMRVGVFFDNGIYDEKDGSKGVIDELSTFNNYNVLPNDFYNIGITFGYGLANMGPYTRVWRPYFQVYPYYNSDIEDYTYGIDVGVGGKVWHQDHLQIGASYTDSVNGVGGSIFELFLKYQFLYMHP